MGPAADNWAAGVVLYTLMFGVEPFKGHSETNLFKKINLGKVNFPNSSHPDFNKRNDQRDYSQREPKRGNSHSPFVLRGSQSQRHNLKMRQYEKAAHKRCQTSYGLGDCYYLEQIYNAGNESQLAAPTTNQKHPDPFCGLKISYSKNVKNLIKDLL